VPLMRPPRQCRLAKAAHGGTECRKGAARVTSRVSGRTRKRRQEETDMRNRFGGRFCQFKRRRKQLKHIGKKKKCGSRVAGGTFGMPREDKKGRSQKGAVEDSSLARRRRKGDAGQSITREQRIGVKTRCRNPG